MYDPSYRPDLSTNKNFSAGSLYEARTFYNDGTIPHIIDNAQIAKIPFSDIYREHAFYGILDNSGDVISPFITDVYMDICGTTENGENLYLQNFVIKALADLKKDLKNKLLTCVPPGESVQKAVNSPFFNFQVVDAVKINNSVATANLAYAAVMGSAFKRNIANKNEINSKIISVKDFIYYFTDFLIKNKLGAVTKTRMQCNTSFSYFNSGLTFSISQDDTGDDENKFDKYYNDIGFEQFCTSCIQYGFMIDKNIPFILTADLSSPFMKKYWINDNIQSIEDLLSKRYYKVYKEDFDGIKKFYWVAYLHYVDENPYIPQDLKNVCIKEILQYVQNLENYKRLDFSDGLGYYKFTSYINEKFWIRLYLYMKIQDMNLDIEQKQFENTLNTCYSYLNFSLDMSIKYINSLFDETKGHEYFDYLQRIDTMVEQPVSSGHVKLKL